MVSISASAVTSSTDQADAAEPAGLGRELRERAQHRLAMVSGTRLCRK